MSAYKLVLTLVTGEIVTIPYYDYAEVMDAARDVMNHPKSYTMKDGAGDVRYIFYRNSAIIKATVVKKGEEER